MSNKHAPIHRRPVRTILALLSLVLFAQCGAEAVDRQELVEQGLVNASPLPVGKFPGAVVWSTGDILCSGTVVGKRYIATAAHCVSKTALASIEIEGETYEYEGFLPETRDDLKPGMKLYVTNARTAGVDVEAAPWKAFTIKTARISPPWFRGSKVAEGEPPPDAVDMLDDGRPDVALLEVAEFFEKVLPGVKSAVIDARPVFPGKPVTITGYGCEKWDLKDGELVDNWGDRVTAEYARTSVLTPEQVSSIYELLWPGEEWASVEYIKEHDLIGYHFIAGPQYGVETKAKRPVPGLCPGDSGGGMFREGGENLLIGIASGAWLVEGGSLTDQFGRFDSPRHPLGRWFRDSLPTGSVLLK